MCNFAILIGMVIGKTNMFNRFTTGNAASTESSVLCRELDPKLSAQRRCAESKWSSTRHRKNPRYRRIVPRGNRGLSAQTSTHGTEDLCRELQKRALGTDATSRRNVTAVTAVCPAVRCAESPLLALGTEHLCRVPAKGSRQRIKKINFTHSNLFFINLHPYKKHMLKFHIKIDI
jgi:hypothetical protein